MKFADSTKSGRHIHGNPGMRRIVRYSIEGLLISIVAVLAARYLLSVFKNVTLEEILNACGAVSIGRIMLAAVFTVCAYAVMTGYDTLGLRHAGSSLQYKKIAVVSFIGDALNANVGLSAFLGSAVKLKLYAKYGEKASTVIRAIASYTLAYWAGMCLLFACFRIAGFLNPAELRHGIIMHAAAFAALSAAALYLAVCSRRLPLFNRIKALSVIAAGRRGIGLFAVSLFDWFLSAAACFTLLPGYPLRAFPAFCCTYFSAQTAAVTSQIPGGLGVFESVMIALAPGDTPAALLAAFFLFRLIFYVVPFCAATTLFAVLEAGALFKKRRTLPADAHRENRCGTTFVPFISVVVPAYNEEYLLPSCLHALRNQDYRGQYEIIVVDNASTDATAEIARSYGCRVVHEAVKGYCCAVRKGFAEARGDIIACTDADTIVASNWLSKIAANLLIPGTAACSGVFRFHDGSFLIKTIGHIFGRFNYHLAGANMAVWADAYRRIGGFDSAVNLGADVELGLRLGKIGKVTIDRRLIVTTSSRRFSSAFFKTVFTYYFNDLWLYVFKKPFFSSFRDFRSLDPRTAPSYGIVSVLTASAIIILLSALRILELPSNQLLGKVLARGSQTRCIALTFDDGPGTSTQKILDILEKYGAKATFFVIGRNAAQHPELLRRIAAEGHEIGNHTFNHPLKTAIEPPRMFTREIDSAEAVIRSITGVCPVLFRPPRGWRNPWMIRECNARGYTVVMWSIDTRDWQAKHAADIVNRVVRNVKDGSIILMHDRINTGRDMGVPRTVEALPLILDTLTRAGFSFVTISELQLQVIGRAGDAETLADTENRAGPASRHHENPTPADIYSPYGTTDDVGK